MNDSLKPRPSVILPDIHDGEDKSSILKNRIRKNYRHIRKWAKRTGTNCFRVYDRDIKQYPLSIDFYDNRFCVHYFAKDNELDGPSKALKEEINQTLGDVFQALPSHVYWKTRSKHKATRQYEKNASTEEFFCVQEYGAVFKVNLSDYIDTGLFLDHRETRQQVASLSNGKRVLNLFAYTSSFSVHAALNGASFTKSVDMSNTYIRWSEDNFRLNAIPLDCHRFVRADCLKFLDEECSAGIKYDLIIIDPPTISRSKKMDQLFDVQEDYIGLLEKSLILLSDKGTIFFSTNSRHFVFASEKFPSCVIKEISHLTIPIDFHNKKIHRCWKINKNHLH
jgi:23S rRNA G2069 N7-methylase RlmK/C1962 C5-methylase RlmI